MKAKKLRKVILSFALSAALLAQPVAGMPAVRAEEAEATEQLTEGGPSSDDITTDDQESGVGNDDQEEPDDPDKKDDETENPGKEDENREKDEETDGSTEGESGDATDEEEPDDVTDEEEAGEEDPEEETGDLGEAEDGGTVSGNEIDETSNLDGFSDMPSNYKLNLFQQEMKADMLDVLSQLDENDEGVTYVEGQVYTFASSQEEAEMIAEAYHAEIVNYSMGVLTLNLSQSKTVKAALQAASNMDNSLPAVWPNYQRELYEEVEPEAEESMISSLEVEEESMIPGLEVEEEEYSIDDEMPQEELEDGIISPEAYEQALSELSGGYDPYLSTGSTSYQWFHNTIGSPYAWDAGYQGKDIKVGVIDSGIDSNNDLSGRVFGGKNFCNSKGSTGDSLGHGTHVAGIIAASKNGKLGTGVAPQATIYNAKVFDSNSELSGTDSTIIAAINYLINEETNVNSNKINTNNSARVDIINMSLGGPGFTKPLQLVLNKAYEKGVIVFAATGNDGGSLSMVPAACSHVIGVAATDNNNQRAYFSNYGSTADLAAPGVDIWATYGSGDGYKSLQGTSMACPVAAGEAAVILSGQDALSALKGKTGKARVNAVESIMKSNTISAGSGMGKGITSLTKVFKLSVAAAKPNAPKITAQNVSTATEQKMNITIEAQAGMKICYTTDGKNPVFLKDGTVGTGTYLVTTNTKTIQVNGKDAAKGTVKAIAVNASGVVSSVKSYKYTLKPLVAEITISGPKRVEQNKTIQLTASVTPAYAANKAVEWNLKKGSSEVDPKLLKIDAKGKITTTLKAAVGTYTVTAKAKDGSGKTATYTFEVIKANTGIQKIAFAKDVKKELWLDATPAENKVSLFEKVTAEEKTADGKKNQPVADRNKLKQHLVWTSSKPAVATVDSSGNVTALAAGTTTITVKTDDNLAKKATVNITVKQAVKSIEIKADNFTVAAGKSLALKANIQPVKPTNNKVNWSIAPASGTSDTDIKKKNISINKTNGKITVKPTANAGKYTVTAEAADKKGSKPATKTITVVAGAIGEIKLDKTKVTLFTTNADGGTTGMTIKATIKGVKGKETDFVQTAYKVTSSDTSVVTATPKLITKGQVEIALNVVGTKYGKANVVIASTDGSNKKATCVVTVSGGISKVELVDGNSKKVSKLTLFRKGLVTSAPSKATLYANISGSKGANKKAYEVKSNNPLVKVIGFNAATGKIDLEASSSATGTATITVMATDGSKKKATCTVTVVNPASRINIAPKAGTTRYVVPGKSVQLTATMETEFGAVSNKKVKWSLDGGDGLVSVNASGKVSVNKGLKLDNTYYANVIATAQDGSGVKAEYKVYLTPPTTKVLLAWNVKNKGWIALMKPNSLYTVSFVSDCTSPMICTTSSAGVASPTIDYSPAYYDKNKKQWIPGTGTIQFVTTKKGRATLTVKALDSSGKSDSMVIQVQ